MMMRSHISQGYALPLNSGKDRSRRGPPPANSAAAQKKPPKASHGVRIIAGAWRGRRIRFPAVADLRPTPDRVRETLFNWLQGVVVDARCLDLFAGSGALGLEALSRGASGVVFVEQDRSAAEALAGTLATLRAPQGQVVREDAFRYLARPSTPFDIVFLDPPFAKGWLIELCTLLEAGGWLAPRAFIYLEARAREAIGPLPSSWEAVRDTRAGDVHGVLARRAPAAGAAAAASDQGTT
jgi:16S rRNA (guanine966-N2)-methyltransferase